MNSTELLLLLIIALVTIFTITHQCKCIHARKRRIAIGRVDLIIDQLYRDSRFCGNQHAIRLLDHIHWDMVRFQISPPEVGLPNHYAIAGLAIKAFRRYVVFQRLSYRRIVCQPGIDQRIRLSMEEHLREMTFRLKVVSGAFRSLGGRFFIECDLVF